MPRISSTLTITNNSESKIISQQSFETSSSSKKQDLSFLTQSMQTLKDADVNLLTDLGKKQQQVITNSTTTTGNKKKQRSSEEDEEDEALNEDDEEEELNDDENKTKKIKN